MSEKIGTAAGVASYLKSLKWNGKHNISALARQTAFYGSTQADRVLYSFLTSAVARALEPGCAVNHALVLVGVHGVGKTWLLSELGGKWHRVMHGGQPDPSVWIQERQLADASDVASTYATHDVYRDAYEKCAVSRPRAYVTAFTCNDYSVLRRASQRRLHVLELHERVALDSDIRDQLWAEAYARYLRSLTPRP